MISRWVSLGITAVLLVIVGVLLFPWGASAFYLEKAGRALDAGSLANHAAAEQALRRALRWDPSNADVYRLLAQAREAQGDVQGMVEALVQYVALRPSDPQKNWQLAVACDQLDVTELASLPGQPCGSDAVSREAAVIHFLQRAGQTVARFVQNGDALRAEGAADQAAVSYKRALSLDATSLDAWQGLAQTYQILGDVEGALEAWSRVVALGQNSSLLAAAHCSRGTILARENRWAEASAELAEAVALAPEQGSYHLDYGWFLYQAGGTSRAVQAELESAAALMPNDPWPYLRLAMIAFADGDYGATVERASQAIAVQPELFWGWVWQGQGLTRQGRLGEAEASLRHAVELAPGQAAPHGGLGRALLAGGRLDGAIFEFEQAVSLAPDELGYRLGLADAHRVAGRVGEAVAVYQRLLELDPGNETALGALRQLRP